MPDETHLVLYAKKKNEEENLQVEHRIWATIVSTKIKPDRSSRRLPFPIILGNQTSSEKSGGKVTNEDLQATMMQVLKTMENITLENREEVSRPCSLTRSLQRRLDLEYSTPKNGYTREMMREESPEKEPVIPLFPLLEEKKDK
ncbi:hypothetical protein ACFX15_036671 [Malus domestica]